MKKSETSAAATTPEVVSAELTETAATVDHAAAFEAYWATPLAAADAAAAEAIRTTPTYAPVADKLASYKAPRGLETAMVEQLRKDLTATYTVQGLVDALVASGAYAKVAPQAAALRPRKPVAFLLRKFAAAGIVAQQ